MSEGESTSREHETGQSEGDTPEVAPEEPIEEEDERVEEEGEEEAEEELSIDEQLAAAKQKRPLTTIAICARSPNWTTFASGRANALTCARIRCEICYCRWRR